MCREGVRWPTFEIMVPRPYLRNGLARNFKFGALKQNANVRDDQNRKYNSNMVDVRFLKSQVLITQAWFELPHRNLVSR